MSSYNWEAQAAVLKAQKAAAATNYSKRQELRFSGKTLYWNKSDGRGNSTSIKTFTLESDICDAMWCDFNGDHGNLTCICAADQSRLEIYGEDGSVYPSVLPFQVSTYN